MLEKWWRRRAARVIGETAMLYNLEIRWTNDICRVKGKASEITLELLPNRRIGITSLYTKGSCRLWELDYRIIDSLRGAFIAQPST